MSNLLASTHNAYRSQFSRWDALALLYIYNINEIVLLYSNNTPAPPICAPFPCSLPSSFFAKVKQQHGAIGKNTRKKLSTVTLSLRNDQSFRIQVVSFKDEIKILYETDPCDVKLQPCERKLQPPSLRFLVFYGSIYRTNPFQAAILSSRTRGMRD